METVTDFIFWAPKSLQMVTAAMKLKDTCSLEGLSLVDQTVKRLPTMWETGFNPWVRKISWRRKWQPTPVLLPEESQGRGSLVGCRLWRRTELDTTEATQQQQGHTIMAVRVLVPRPGINPRPLQWKPGVLTTGTPWKVSEKRPETHPRIRVIGFTRPHSNPV